MKASSCAGASGNSRPELLIRAAGPEDAPAVARIHVSAWRAAYRGLIPDSVLDSLDVSRRAAFWSRLLSAPHRTLISEAEGTVTGFCSLVPSRDPDAERSAVVEIAALYVCPEHWRRGAGRALCLAAFEATAAGGFKDITLWVLSSNHAAILFYEHLGFHFDAAAARVEQLPEGVSVHELRMRRSTP